MFYQALQVRECRSGAEIQATYRAARRRLTRPPQVATEATEALEPWLMPLPPLPTVPRHMGAIISLMPVDEVKIPAIDIVSAVAIAHSISMADMKGPRRHTRFVAARFHAIALICQIRPDLSFPVIGKLMNRDHSTIIHAKRHWPRIAGRYRPHAVRVRNLIGFQWRAELPGEKT